MNPRMWTHPATRRNRATSKATAFASSARTAAKWRKAARPGPGGWPNRWKSSRPSSDCSARIGRPLAGRKVIVTSGPTHEPIDPVRYIANRSSGKQGHADRRRACPAGRRGAAGFRPGGDPRSGGRRRHPCGDGARRCRRRWRRAAGRRRRLRCRRRRLACRSEAAQKIKKTDGRVGAVPGADREPGHPCRASATIRRDARPRHRLRRRDGEVLERPGEARPQGRRLHRRQRRLEARAA